MNGVMLLRLSVSLAMLSAGGQSPEAERWVDHLKHMSVNQIEDGLPATAFDEWITGLLKANPVEYDVMDCEHGKASGGTSQKMPLCVIAYTPPPHPDWRRQFQLTFACGGLSTGLAGVPEAKPGSCKLIAACEGPSDPRMMRPTRCVSKLSDFEKLVPQTAHS